MPQREIFKTRGRREERYAEKRAQLAQEVNENLGTREGCEEMLRRLLIMEEFILREKGVARLEDLPEKSDDRYDIEFFREHATLIREKMEKM